MKYFIDTEFIYVAASSALVTPLSIGIVAEDGREFYRVNHGAVRDEQTIATHPPFVRDHVIPALPMPGHDGGIGGDYVMPIASISYDLRFFIGDDAPEFWGEYSAFDYVVLSTIMGGFDNWPEGWPMWINDIKQEAMEEVPSSTPHNALADARAVRNAFMWATGGAYATVQP